MASSNSNKKARVSISTEADSQLSLSPAESHVEHERIKFEDNLTLANQRSHQHGGDGIRIYEQGKGKKRKEFWNDFKSYRDKDNKKRAECIHCHKTFAADPIINGTNNLSRHWEACGENRRSKGKGTQTKLVFSKGEGTQTKLVFEKAGKKDSLKVEDSDEHDKMGNWVLDESKVREALIRMIALGEVPFTSRGLYNLKEFASVICPQFAFPSNASIVRDCYDLFLKEKEKLKEFLKTSCQRVCLTMGSWTSIEEENYKSLTAHFIDNEWKFQKRVLNFCLLDTDGDETAGVIKCWLKSWDLCDKVFSITVDNASANDVACDHLRKMVIKNGSCINHGNNLQVTCVAQIVNLIVWGVLKEYSADVDKVRATVRFFKYEPGRVRAFKKQVELEGVECRSSLHIDLPTRWNSTYKMLDVALKYFTVFEHLETPTDMDGLEVGHVTLEEWTRIEMLVNFLKEFYDLAKHVSSSSEVSVNTVFLHIDHIVSLLNQWVETSDPVCRRVTLQMKMICDKYWGDLDKMNMLVFVAMILDPSYKYRGLQVAIRRLYGSEAGDTLAAKVKEFAYELFSEYTNIYPPAPKSEPSKSSAPVPSFIKEVKRKLDEQDRAAGLITELDWYLHELNEPGVTDILTWWRLNAHRFPTLAHMARDVLAISVSTLSSENVFIHEECTLKESRSSLNPMMLQALVCTEDWLGGGSHDSESDEEPSSEEMEQTEKDSEEMLAGVFHVSDLKIEED